MVLFLTNSMNISTHYSVLSNIIFTRSNKFFKASKYHHETILTNVLILITPQYQSSLLVSYKGVLKYYFFSYIYASRLVVQVQRKRVTFFTSKNGALREIGEYASWLRISTNNTDVTRILCMKILALLAEI